MVVNALKTWLTGAAPELWLFVIGALFIAVTLLFPKGLLGLWDQLRSRLRPQQVDLRDEVEPLSLRVPDHEDPHGGALDGLAGAIPHDSPHVARRREAQHR